MARKKQEEKEMNFEAWLLPYADMITLLLSFFIIMYALTLMEKAKAEKIIEEIAKAMGGAPAASSGAPGLVSGGKTFPNPIKKNDGRFKKGTNKKVSYIDNTGNRETLGNIVNISGDGGTLESKYIGTDPKLVEALLKLDASKFARSDTSSVSTADKGFEGGDLVLKMGKPKKSTTEEVVLGPNETEETKSSGGGLAGDNYFKDIFNKMTMIFDDEKKHGSIEIKVTQRGIEMILQGDMIFELGSAELMPASYKMVQKVGAVLLGLHNQGFEFRVEGHTDNINVHSFLYPSNWELSCARAVSVLRYFTEEMGLPPESIAASGMGRYKPIDTNDTVEGRKKNRRIEILIFDPVHPIDVTSEFVKRDYKLRDMIKPPESRKETPRQSAKTEEVKLPAKR